MRARKPILFINLLCMLLLPISAKADDGTVCGKSSQAANMRRAGTGLVGNAWNFFPPEQISIEGSDHEKRDLLEKVSTIEITGHLIRGKDVPPDVVSIHYSGKQCIQHRGKKVRLYRRNSEPELLLDVFVNHRRKGKLRFRAGKDSIVLPSMGEEKTFLTLYRQEARPGWVMKLKSEIEIITLPAEDFSPARKALWMIEAGCTEQALDFLKIPRPYGEYGNFTDCRSK